MKTSVIEVHAMLSVLSVDEVERRIAEGPGVNSVTVNFASKNATDQALWSDWYKFTLELALLGAYSADATEQKFARVFIVDALTKCGRGAEVFANPTVTRAARRGLCDRVRT